MKKLTAVLLSATMLLSLCPAFTQDSYDIKAVAAENVSAKFDEDEFYVVVGKYGEFTQLRYLVRSSDGSYSAEKVVWETAPEGLVYGDVLTAEGKVLMEQVRPANDPVYAMAYYYKLDDSAKLTKVGKCSALMELKDLVVKSVTYDGSAHWSIDYTDTSGLKEYYYGLSTFGSSLGVDPISCKEGDVYTFAAISGNIVVPLAKKLEEGDYITTDKTMTISDVREFAKKEDDLDWSDFDEYVYEWGSNAVFTNICSFRLEDNYGLYVCGNPPAKPDKVTFFRYDPINGIDIRQNNLEEFLDWTVEIAQTTAIYTNVTTTTTTTAETTVPKAFIKGDTNCDGEVDMADAVLIMQALANPNKYGENGTSPLHITALGKANADMNGDGLTVGDAHAIQSILLGLE
jgi:hypothetical protein